MKKNIFQHSGLTATAVLQRSGLSALAVILLLTSCHKETVKEDTFMITPKIIRSNMATFEVVPINNEFFYFADAVTVADYNKWKEQGIADSIMRYYDNVKAELDRRGISYDDEFLYYHGLYDCVTSTLPPETPCYFYCMRLRNRDKSPILPLVLYPFTTTKQIWHDDLAVEMRIDNDTVYYTPNNNDYTYLCDFISLDELRRDYAGSIDYYAMSIISTYEEYGFIHQALQKGPSTLAIFDWYEEDDLHAGDTIITYAVGYEQNNLTTEILADTIRLE